jgi:NTE family protein
MWLKLFSFFSSIVACSSFNQLSFSGGGSFGAVEIGIIKKISEMETPCKKYDLYTGISAGALNSGFLSYFDDIKSGIKFAEETYTHLDNHMIYKLEPLTGVSILNTEPLKKTLSSIINKMTNKPVVHTLIGATNLNSGNLDVYSFEDNTDEEKIQLMMSSSAIPVLFPPITYNNYLYADGGTLSNELLQIENNGKYTNITFISPYEGMIYQTDPIKSIKEMLERVILIVTTNFNNPLVLLNQNCKNPIGEINKYFVNSKYLKEYNMMNFNHGKELIDIGYKYMEHKKYVLC